MDRVNKKIRILLTGGGTLGSVSPLLAIAEDLREQKGDQVDFFWLGTKFGPEKEVVEKSGIKFKPISGGKWRRYFSFKNLADIIKIKLAFFQAFFLLLKWRPSIIISAGSFISVPVVWAGWCLMVPVLVHQQDVQPGLANKLMAPFARAITVTFAKSLADYGQKAVWIGNPVRKKFQISNFNFQLNSNLPILLVLGGGTGAIAINRLVLDCLDELTKFCQIIHVTGKNKNLDNESRIINYKSYEFLNAERIAAAMQAADLVVTRAGLGVLSELSFLGKPAIIIPMPDSHQEANADFFKVKTAAIVISQKELTVPGFCHLVKDLLADEKMRAKLGQRIKTAMKSGASQAMVEIIEKNLKV